METVIDWSKAPENCVGALAAKVGNIHFPKVTFAKSVIHENGRVRGESCDGIPLCAYLDVWIWEDRPWTVDGLPTVGTVCEFAGGAPCPEDPFDKDLKEGMKVTIIAHFKCGDFTLAAFTFDPENPDRGMVQVEQGNFGCFRPIRTPEQIEAEARQKGIEELGNFLSTNTTTPTPFLWEAAQKIYDAGYRKQVAP